MGTKPSTMEDKTEGLLNELEAFVDETDKLKEIRAEEERKRISLLIGVDVSDLTWIKDGQGTQSSQFDLMGDRWGGRAFVKGQKLWVQEELEKGKQLLHRIEKLQNQQGEVDSQEEQKGIIGKRPETTVFLKREREFFRCWWDAKSKGELVLPEDTALMLPKLIEPLMVDNAKVEEENTPTFLIFENLVEKGYQPMDRLKPLTMEDEKVIAKALADLHWGMFQIREKLKSGYVEMIQGMFATVDAAGENMNEIKLGQKQELERCINGFGKGFRKDLYDFFVTHVDQIRDLMLSPAKFNWYTHGDPIIENIMLKRNTEGVITGVAFIDFANVGLQSPLFDLFGFVYTSLKYDVEPPSMKDVQDVYKARLSECFPASELPGFASGEFYFTEDDVLVSLCKVLRYFLDDNAWNKTDELLFRQLEPFWRVYFILKRREEKKLNEDVPGTVEALPSLKGQRN